MESKDWWNIAAIVFSAIFAVQLQKWWENRRMIRTRKLNLFRSLMRTRAALLSAEHVGALNMIDVEFYHDKKVISAWRSYLDHLGIDANQHGWDQRREDLFVDLLLEMSNVLGYDFDKTMLRRTAYTPVGHGDVAWDNETIRKGMADILSGRKVFPVGFYPIEQPNSQPEEVTQ
jgi:hypothetical protein